MLQAPWGVILGLLSHFGERVLGPLLPARLGQTNKLYQAKDGWEAIPGVTASV